MANIKIAGGKCEIIKINKNEKGSLLCFGVESSKRGKGEKEGRRQAP